ncbi:TonB-dependent receptor [Bacteroides helcogenes]|uniref:TonB-dependent receptor plug n=1 Tax=Bacteroides helcogenes (strain ATCC 35417 / DSM 20613 / JCM 6297 / CCUG 15421 / P 36-108) TaxID=693979 RepID=E6SNZ1_BACT6|nr:TonB-dependent receptor [Bacteroides helcogenes]ADV42809.1 TonB-dependent receptor plug [Bacteroides helcogenes P 36-108]MDY5239639.1 TonB-dependent receptor [Bacteroides helcogenes]
MNKKLCLLFFTLLFSFINVFSQSEKIDKPISIQFSNLSLKEALNKFEQVSGYTFFYDAEQVNLKQTVSMNVKQATVGKAVTELLKNTDLGFEIANLQITLISKKASVAQQKKEVKISGIVSDDTGEPVIGANVSVQGTTIGAITDLDGRYTLNVPAGSTLIISYIGYINRQVKVNAAGNYDIRLKEDSEMLNEVVVVGYGTQKKVNLSGSVATVDSKELQNRPIQNLTNGLQGLMPGVTITGTNGAPGQDNGNIRVRGTGTLNTASPYILIDGVESGTLNAIDPNDIESISVLKDAASAAIYGSKASNGVILITTKRGKTGKPQISYSGYVSFQNATNMIERLSSAEYAALYNSALKAEGKAERFTADEIAKFESGTDPKYPNTDWYGLAYKTGIQHRHNININGGAENASYMASIGYLNQTGVLPNAGREQFNARTNLDMKLSKRFTARMNLAFIKNKYDDASSAYAGGSSDQIIRQLNLIAPWIVARNDDGTWGTISDGSPIAWLDSGMKVTRDNYNFTGMAALDYQIMDGLKLTMSGAYVHNMQNYQYFQKFIQYNENKKSDPNSLDERFYKWDRTNYDVLLNYDKSFGQHNLKGLLGWHTEKYNYKYQKAYRKNFPNNELTDMNAGDSSTQKNEGFTRELAMISWFARVNYDYAGKYLLEANIRSDASSRFAEGNRWGYFPSFSAAWRMSEEAFMENAKSWLSTLKLRASWGMLGNQDALDDYYPALNTYNLDATYPFDGSLNSGYYQKKYRLSTISWEKATTWGIGLDLGFLNNKINATIDYYNRKTTGILMDVPVPSEFALDAYKDNVGAMRNSGVELNVSYNDKFGDWKLGVAANFTYNKNEILDLGFASDVAKKDQIREVSGGYKQQNHVGGMINSYYIYEADGFFNSQEEADAYTEKYKPSLGGGKLKAGDIRYVDTNGDGLLTEDDRVYCNSPEPAYTFGLNLNAGYKGFDLSLMFNGAAKVARLFDSHEVYGAFSGDAGHPASIWKNAWTETNHNADMPRIFTNTNSPSSSRNVQSTFWLQNTSYLRLKNLQLGYTFPKEWLSSLGVQNLRLYYSVENLLTIDGMKINIDPEATSQRMSSYPLLRTHAFGVNISF